METVEQQLHMVNLVECRYNGVIMRNCPIRKLLILIKNLWEEHHTKRVFPMIYQVRF